MTSAKKHTRIEALDFVKGALVLIMVLYHWLNYFASPALDYRYLRFLTPSFLFITGFLISHIYLSKPVSSNGPAKRLLARAVKLLAVFVALNVAKAMISGGTSAPEGGQFSMRDVAAVFGVGPSDTDKVMSFYILIPISYVLMVAAALTAPFRAYRYTFHVVTALLLLIIAALSAYGFYSPNLDFVTLGLLGVVCGFTSLERIDGLASHYGWLAVAYAAYLIAIARWNVPFGLLIIGVGLTLLAIYVVAVIGDQSNRARQHVILLGQYSLFGYIAQIAILQGLSAASRGFTVAGLGIYVSFLAAFAMTMAAVELVAAAKTRSITVDRLYRAVFA